MSYREAFAPPRVHSAEVRFGASPARRHRVSIRAPGAREIRVHQVNAGSTWLKTSLKDSITVRTLKRQAGRRADSPAKLQIRVFWKAGGSEFFPATAVGDREFTLVPSPGMAGTTQANNAATGAGSGTGSGAGGYADADVGTAPGTQNYYTDTTYDTVPPPTPWSTILVGGAVALSAGYLGYRALRG